LGEMQFALRGAQITQPLAQTASRVNNMVDPIAADLYRTVGILRTTAGIYGSGASEPLEPNQIAALRSQGIEPVGTTGVHAERNLLPNTPGLPLYLDASRPFCPGSCVPLIEGAEVLITSPTTAIFPRNISLGGSTPFPFTRQ